VLLALYVVSVPLTFQVGWLSVYVQLGLFLVLLVRVVDGLHRVSFTRPQVVVLVVFGLTVCATIAGKLFAPSGQNLDKLPETIRFLILALACSIELDSTRRVRQLLTVVTVTAAVVALLSVLNLAVTLPFARTTKPSLGPLSISRSIGILMPFADFGLLAIAGGSFAAMGVLRPRLLHGTDCLAIRLLSATALLLILAGVVVGQSRSTWLAFVAAGTLGILVAAAHPDSRIRALVSAISDLLLLIGIVGVGISAVLLARSLIDSNVRSVTMRLEQYRFALDLIAQRPLSGWGWQSFKMLFPEGIAVHNLWLRLGVSLGIPIMLLWIGLFAQLGVSIIRRALDCRPQLSLYGIIGLAIFGGVIELLFHTGFTSGTAVFVGLLTGMLGIGFTRSETD